MATAALFSMRERSMVSMLKPRRTMMNEVEGEAALKKALGSITVATSGGGPWKSENSARRPKWSERKSSGLGPSSGSG